MTQYKRVVTDFRHLSTQIAKNNLAYPVLKAMFTLLGSSKCEVLSVLDLKDTFHSLDYLKIKKKYCGILPYFGSASYLYQRMPMGPNIAPAIWQSYQCNAGLFAKQEVLQGNNDLLLFAPSKTIHLAKLGRLIESIT